MKVIGQIYEEDDYNKFKRLANNRDVIENRLNKLIASISEKYICNPIIVNEKMEVIDGQGRFEACKALGKPIQYIIAYGANANDCIRMNKYNTKWATYDFAISYAKTGSQAYIRLLDVCKKTSISIQQALRLVNHGAKVKNTSEMSAFERGELEFTKDDYLLVIKIIDMEQEIIEALQFTGRINDAFRVGGKVVFETDGYNHNRMVRNCEKYRGSYHQMARLSDQLLEFERIYNKGSRGKSLYFSDYMRNRGFNVRDYGSYSKYNDNDISTLEET